jgi:hypothetical protein
MKMLVPTVAALGVLAVGAVPAIGLSFPGTSSVNPADKNADGKPGYGPPPHAQSGHDADKSKLGKDKLREDMPNAHAAKMSALGRAHGEAMRTWSRCVHDDAGNDVDGLDPKQACGPKPVPPGHVKHQANRR